MATVITQNEYLTFDAVASLHAVPTGTPGWKGLNYSPLYRTGPRVGGNRPIPGATGRLYVARELDELSVSLHIRVNGAKDREGNTHADPFLGVRTNLLYLRKHVLDYVPQRGITFHMRDGSSVTGAAVIEGWEDTVDPESAGDIILLAVRLTIAAGVLVVPA